MFLKGTWTVRDIKPSSEGKAQKVKVKVRVNLHGIMTVSSASLIESKEPVEQEQMEEQAAPPEQNGGEQSAEGSNGAPPEVGPSWSKRISAWFGRVRIDSRAGLACVNYYYFIFLKNLNINPFKFFIFSFVFCARIVFAKLCM